MPILKNQHLSIVLSVDSSITAIIFVNLELDFLRIFEIEIAQSETKGVERVVCQNDCMAAVEFPVN